MCVCVCLLCSPALCRPALLVIFFMGICYILCTHVSTIRLNCLCALVFFISLAGLTPGTIG